MTDMRGKYWAMDRDAIGHFASAIRPYEPTERALELAADFRRTMIESAHGMPSVEQARRFGLPLSMSGDVAVMEIASPIMDRADYLVERGVVGNYEIQQMVAIVAADESARELIVKFDTPGGNVSGLAAAADSLHQLGQSKRVTAYVDGMAASAGYWLASQSDEVVVGRASMLGSIGVFTAIEDSSEFFSDMGIRVIPISTGEHKTTGMDGVPVTDAQVAEEQKIVDTFFAQFLGDIERGRPEKAESISAIADGRVFVGQQAIDNGLADRMGTFVDVLGEAMARKPVASSARRNAARASLAILSLTE